MVVLSRHALSFHGTRPTRQADTALPRLDRVQMLEFMTLAQQCAPTVDPATMAAIVHVESGYQPWAIGVVGGRLARQPATREEAVATAKDLAAKGWNFSMGVAQVNRANLPRYNIDYEQAFDPCTSLRVGSKILEDCFVRARRQTADPQAALRAAISCYYAGNFTRGFRPDAAGQPSYVAKVVASAGLPAKAIPVVPAIKPAPAATPPDAAPRALLPSTPDAQPAASPALAPIRLRRGAGAADTDPPSAPHTSAAIVF